MSRVRVCSFSVSLDGYGAGADQSLDHPMGIGGRALHQWAFETRTFRQMFGQEGGSTGIDDQFAARGFENIGAWILGRNMFGPVRGQWLNEEWKGWWDDNPPYHCPVYVLTHHRRPPLIMQGGTTFYFVIDGIHAALRQARDSAGGREIRIGEKFSLLSGQNATKDFQFNKHAIHHLFCTNCGIESFARGKGPDGTEMVAINVRCVDDLDIRTLKVKQVDGRSR
jgi:dihydrofolate reductase